MTASNHNLQLPFPQKPWDDNDNVIWLASQLRLYRNLQKFHFPGKLSTEQRSQILSIVQQELLNLKDLDGLKLYPAEDVDPIGKEFLHEHFFATDSFHQARTGEAFFVDDSGKFLGVVNIRNHLQLICLEQEGEIERTWSRLVQLETELGKVLEYAFNSEFGFLTADPHTCGTAMVGTIFLHLPALIHTEQLTDALNKHADEGVLATGLQGNPEDLVGDILAVHNRYTLGLTEESILSSLRSYSTQLMLEERSARRQLQGQEKCLLKDEVSRAFGLLKHSFRLETIESMAALSLLKLGLDLEWVSGTTVQALNHLLIICRRAHLQAFCQTSIDGEELAQRRAQVMHDALKDIELAL